MSEHTVEDQDILRRAGMSMQSELTADEQAGLRRAKFALAENPTLTRDALYRMIRPRRDDE